MYMKLPLRVWWSSFASAFLLTAVSTTLVLGQGLPMPDSGAQQGNGQNAANGNPYHGYGADYPAPEVQAVPMAFARVVSTREEQDQMLGELRVTVDRIREDFNYSPEMLAATREQNSAFDAYDDARRKVLDRLSEDPTYRAMISLVVTLKHKLEDERPGPKPTSEELERVLATATLKLSYASAASAMEVASLSADADVMQTHARLIQAAEKIGVMRADFERGIHRNPEFLAARRNLDDARIARLTADAFYNGALDARNIAMNYSYYLHRFDQYSYAPSAIGYAPYPYGYGYGYGDGRGEVGHGDGYR
jgi:hypothetical protein